MKKFHKDPSLKSDHRFPRPRAKLVAEGQKSDLELLAKYHLNNNPRK